MSGISGSHYVIVTLTIGSDLVQAGSKFRSQDWELTQLSAWFKSRAALRQLLRASALSAGPGRCWHKITPTFVHILDPDLFLPSLNIKPMEQKIYFLPLSFDHECYIY